MTEQRKIFVKKNNSSYIIR